MVKQQESEGSHICGLVGVVGDLWGKDKDVFTHLLKLDVIRGHHSTGVLKVFDNDECQIVKNLGTTWDMLKEKPVEFFGKDNTRDIQGNIKVLMGHNRWATVGDVNEDNAHPFWQGDIIGCHNGTLSKHEWNRLYDADRFGTDSETIMHNININGIEQTSKILGGAYALTWWNRQKKTFNILRNKERPLTFATNKSRRVMYYASEDWMLEQAFERFNIDASDIYYLSVDTHYEIDVAKANGFDFDKRTTRTEMKGYTPPVYSYNYVRNTSGNVFSPANNKSNQSLESLQGLVGTYQEFLVLDESKDNQGLWYIGGELSNSDTQVRIYTGTSFSDLYKLLNDPIYLAYKGKVKEIKKVGGDVYIKFDHRSIEGITWGDRQKQQKQDLDDEIPWERIFAERDDLDTEDLLFVQDPNDESEMVSRQEWDAIVKCGCAWCTYQPEMEDFDRVMWLNKKDFLCGACAEDEVTVEYVNNVMR